MNTVYWCINLTTRKDRYEHCRKEFEKIGLLTQIQFYHPDPSSVSGSHGCWMSHRHCIEQSVKTHCDCIVIFEDDVLFDDKWQDGLREFYSLQNRQNVDIIYFGGFVYRYLGDRKAIVDNTQAYALSRSFAERCLSDPQFHPEHYHGLDVDDYYKYKGNCWILKNHFAWQYDNKTNTEWNGPRLYQSLTQWSPSTYLCYQKANNWVAGKLHLVRPAILQTIINPFSFTCWLCEIVTYTTGMSKRR